MSVAFEAAWMLLKQRGHELNLPKPVRQDIGPYESDMSPQDLIDARVDAASKQRHALNEIEMAGTQNPRINSMDDAMAFLDNQRFNQNEMEDQLFDAQNHEGEEAYYQGEQGALDRETLARRAQQPEADEMEAMGVPPMSRTLGGTPPANLGRAGSSGRPPVGSDDISDGLAEHRPRFTDSYTNLLNQYGPLDNPFPSPVGLNVRDDLMDWAAGAGREAGKPGIVERTENPFEDLSEMHDGDMYDEIHNEPLHENNPAKHNIASTTLRASPRQQKRGKIDEPRATPRMQGRAARSTSPFIGGE